MIVVTYDDHQKYKLKKLEAVKKEELEELKSQIISLKQTVENNKRTLDYIKQYVYNQEQQQLHKELQKN